MYYKRVKLETMPLVDFLIIDDGKDSICIISPVVQLITLKGFENREYEIHS